MSNLSYQNITYAAGLIGVLIYATIIQKDPPSIIRNLFKNEIFRFVFLALLLIMGPIKSNPSIACIIAFIYVFTLYCISEREIEENFTYLEAFKRVSAKKTTTYKSSKHTPSKHKTDSP